MHAAAPFHDHTQHVYYHCCRAGVRRVSSSIEPVDFLASQTATIAYRFGSATASSWLEPFHLGVETMQNRIQTPVWVVIIALAMALMVGGLAAPSVHSSTEESTYTVASETRTQMVFEQGFSPVVKSSAPAVVNISSSRTVRPEEGPQAPLNDPFLKKFFGEEFIRQFRVPRERRE